MITIRDNTQYIWFYNFKLLFDFNSKSYIKNEITSIDWLSCKLHYVHSMQNAQLWLFDLSSNKEYQTNTQKELYKKTWSFRSSILLNRNHDYKAMLNCHQDINSIKIHKILF